MQSEIPSGIVNKRISVFENITQAPVTQFSRRMPVTQFSRRTQLSAELCVPAIPRRAPLDVVHASVACVPRATVDALQPSYKLARVLRLAPRFTPVKSF